MRPPERCARISTSVAAGYREATVTDRNSELLGIKYEAARVGGVDAPALARIGEQLRSEVGEGWETDEGVIRGRNAVRREHGLSALGEPAGRPSRPDAPRPLWRRFLGK